MSKWWKNTVCRKVGSRVESKLGNGRDENEKNKHDEKSGSFNSFGFDQFCDGGKVSAELPKDATHYLINLVDENQFLVSYPEMSSKVGGKYSTIALPASKKNVRGEPKKWI